MKSSIRHAIEALGGPSSAARRLGVSSAAIHDWIRRGRIPKLDLAEKVAELSGVELEDLRPTAPLGLGSLPPLGGFF